MKIPAQQPSQNMPLVSKLNMLLPSLIFSLKNQISLNSNSKEKSITKYIFFTWMQPFYFLVIKGIHFSFLQKAWNETILKRNSPVLWIHRK